MHRDPPRCNSVVLRFPFSFLFVVHSLAVNSPSVLSAGVSSFRAARNNIFATTFGIYACFSFRSVSGSLFGFPFAKNCHVHFFASWDRCFLYICMNSKIVLLQLRIGHTVSYRRHAPTTQTHITGVGVCMMSFRLKYRESFLWYL